MDQGSNSMDRKKMEEMIKSFISAGCFVGGIAVQDGPNGWKINRNSKYSFDSSMKGREVFEL